MKTVLVLEDEPCVMDVIRATLKSRSYSVLAAVTADEALHHSVEHAGAIDLFISDIVLPSSSGIQVARQVRTLMPGLAIILMSGYPREWWGSHSGQDMGDLSGAEILPKPFTPLTLLGMVERLIGPGVAVRGAGAG